MWHVCVHSAVLTKARHITSEHFIGLLAEVNSQHGGASGITFWLLYRYVMLSPPTFSFSDTAAACATDLLDLPLLLSSSRLEPPSTKDPSNCRLDAPVLLRGEYWGENCANVRWLAPGRRGSAAHTYALWCDWTCRVRRRCIFDLYVLNLHAQVLYHAINQAACKSVLNSVGIQVCFTTICANQMLSVVFCSLGQCGMPAGKRLCWWVQRGGCHESPGS
jgi:hypothetical protein